MTSTQQTSDLFQEYIAQNMQYALKMVQALDETLPNDEEREMLLHALTFGFELFEAWPQTRQTLVLLAPKMEQAGYRGEWVTFLERGIEVSRERKDLETEAELRLQLGILLQLLSQFDDADVQLASSLECFEALDLRRGKARVLNRQAWVARRKQHLTLAEDLLESAMECLGEYDDQYAYSLLVMGSVRLDQQRWQEAISVNRRALTIWEETKDKRMQAWTYTNMGVAFTQAGDLEQAGTQLQSALVLFDQVDDPVHRAVAAMALGGVFIKLDQPQAALNRFLEAEVTFRHSQEQLRLAHVYNNIGQANLVLDQPRDAINAFEKSLLFWNELSGYDYWRLNVMTGLGTAHRRSGQKQQAIDVFKQALSLLPSIKFESKYKDLASEIANELQLASARNPI